MSYSTAAYTTGGTGSTMTTTATTSSTWYTTPNSTTVWVTDDQTVGSLAPDHGRIREVRIPVPVKDLVVGKSYDLPDGAKLSIDAHGNYTIHDAAAKVVYKANRIREFNPYVNASDLLEDFIRDMGQYGVRQSELLGLPVNVFIHWLILKAAQRDGDEARVPSPQAVLPKREIRCLCCGRFLPRTMLQRRIFFCTPDHMTRYASRPVAALPAPVAA